MCVAATLSSAWRACCKNTSPAGVGRRRRVERSSRRAPSCTSSSAICRLTCARVQSSARAQAAMLPSSTVLMKACQDGSQKASGGAAPAARSDEEAVLRRFIVNQSLTS